MMLSPEQERAVRRTGQDACVVAGPGSGKTRVLIERFAWLVEERGVNPERLLAITFTEKAATEIKSRLIDRFANRGDVLEAIERAWVSTIHGFCARLLRENAIAAGLPPDFSVLDQAPAQRLAREAAEETLDALFRERPAEMRKLLEALDLSTQDDGPKPDPARSLLEVLEAMREGGVREMPPRSHAPDVGARVRELAQIALADTSKGATHTELLRDWATRFLALPATTPPTREHFALAAGFKEVHLSRLGKNPARAAADDLRNTVLPAYESQLIEEWNHGLPELLRTALVRIGSLYHAKKRQSSSLDFSDLEEEAVKLLESDAEVRDETAGRFDQILMDELQDTNRLQWRLINLIRRPSGFFAVGDINQSIYGFRHAEPVLFEEYRRGLEQSCAIIDDLRDNHRSRPEILAAVSRVLDGQKGIEPRPLIAAESFPGLAGPIVEKIIGRGENGAEVEAALVAERIRALADSGECDYKNVGILVRVLGSLEPFERALDRFGIPFLTSGGRTFLEAREIRDVLALLATLVNPLDEIALVGVLRGPLAGMSDEEIFKISREAWREAFHERFGRFRALAGFVSPDRLVAAALDESDYFAGLPPRGRANIDKLLTWLRREHRDRPRPLAELLSDLEALRETRSEADAPPPEAGNVVRLMSIHAAKGLEFQVVFVSALHRGSDRSKPVLAFSREAGLGAKWRNPATGKGQADSAYERLKDELKQREDAEENRLLYVAMTRAEQRLFLSYAEKKQTSKWQKLIDSAIPDTTGAEEVPEPVIEENRSAASRGLPEQVLLPPQITGQYDSTAAVTAVSLFHACPRKYFLSSYLRLEPEREASGTGGIALGSDVHRVLAGEEAISAEGVVLAARFSTSELGRRAARATRIEREFDFLLSLEDVVLRGQIDLWFEEAGELILVDYKTDREESPEAYTLQLRMYALALELYAGRVPDRAVLYYLRPDRPIEVSLSPDDLASARSAVREFSTAQEFVEFPLREGKQCQRCAFYRGRCPAGKA